MPKATTVEGQVEQEQKIRDKIKQIIKKQKDQLTESPHLGLESESSIGPNEEMNDSKDSLNDLKKNLEREYKLSVNKKKLELEKKIMAKKVTIIILEWDLKF